MGQQTRVTPRKHPKQGRSKATVDAILEATTRILKRDGADKANTNRIAKVAGVSVGSLYQYFPNKEALMLAVAKRHCTSMLELLAQSVSDLADAPIEEAVRTYVSTMLKAHSLDPALHRVLVAHALAAGLDNFKELDEAAHRLVKGYLEQHKDEIAVTNLDMAAFLLITAVESITHVAATDRRESLASGELEEELTALILRYLGLRTN